MWLRPMVGFKFSGFSSSSEWSDGGESVRALSAPHAEFLWPVQVQLPVLRGERCMHYSSRALRQRGHVRKMQKIQRPSGRSPLVAAIQWWRKKLRGSQSRQASALDSFSRILGNILTPFYRCTEMWGFHKLINIILKNKPLEKKTGSSLQCHMILQKSF